MRKKQNKTTEAMPEKKTNNKKESKIDVKPTVIKSPEPRLNKNRIEIVKREMFYL